MQVAVVQTQVGGEVMPHEAVDVGIRPEPVLPGGVLGHPRPHPRGELRGDRVLRPRLVDDPGDPKFRDLCWAVSSQRPSSHGQLW